MATKDDKQTEIAGTPERKPAEGAAEKKAAEQPTGGDRKITEATAPPDELGRLRAENAQIKNRLDELTQRLEERLVGPGAAAPAKKAAKPTLKPGVTHKLRAKVGLAFGRADGKDADDLPKFKRIEVAADEEFEATADELEGVDLGTHVEHART